MTAPSSVPDRHAALPRLVLLAALAALLTPASAPIAPAQTGPQHGDEAGGAATAMTTEWLDLDRIRAGLRDQAAFELTLGGGTYAVEAYEFEMRAPEWEAYVVADSTRTKEEAPGRLGTYRARLAGETGWPSSLTTVPGYFNLVLKFSECDRLVVDTNLDPDAPERASGAPDSADAVLVDWYREECEDSPPDELDDEEDPNETPLVGTPQEYATVPWEEYNLENLVSGGPPANTVILKAGLDSDAEYYKASPSTWTSRQAAVLNNAENHLYEDQLNIKFQIVRQITWTSGGPTSGSCATVLNALRDDWKLWESSVTRDTVLMMYGRELSGATVGCHRQQPSIQNPKEYAYSVVQAKSRTATEEYRDAAHEIGHGLNGDHGYARKWRSSSCVWTCVKGTIMATNIATKNNVDKFAVNEVNEKKSNEWRVRWCSENKSSCATLPESGQ